MNIQLPTKSGLSTQPRFATFQQEQQYFTGIYNQLVASGYYQNLFLHGVSTVPGSQGGGRHYTKNNIIAATVAVMNTFGAAVSIKQDFNLLLTALLNLYNILAAAASDNTLPPATRQERLLAASEVANLTQQIRSHANSLAPIAGQVSIILNQILVKTQ